MKANVGAKRKTPLAPPPRWQMEAAGVNADTRLRLQDWWPALPNWMRGLICKRIYNQAAKRRGVDQE